MTALCFKFIFDYDNVKYSKWLRFAKVNDKSLLPHFYGPQGIPAAYVCLKYLSCGLSVIVFGVIKTYF